MSEEVINNTETADSSNHWTKIFPTRLVENYKSIHALIKPLRTNTIDDDAKLVIITELQRLLNDNAPQNEMENAQRVQEFVHFYKDPQGYYQHILDAKLRFLVLWTDYRYIINHFRLRNIVHIRWTGERYECQLFDKTKRSKSGQTAVRTDEEIALNETSTSLNN